MKRTLSATTPLSLCWVLLAALFVVGPSPLSAQEPEKKEAAGEEHEGKQDDDKKDKKRFKSSTFGGFKMRGIGPALMSGRISDIAIDPRDRNHWLVATASGGLWATRNAGTAWKPVFDGQKVYSIGCVTFDPSNPNIAWVGSGENNSQRSVAFGDGVYKSVDGGRSWKNVGLKDSEHIGKVLVHPHDSDTVFVAAQGPLWRDGGDRGLYVTRDGGKTWTCILEISKHTGATDVLFDPRDANVMYAASYQRRRHVWTLINGGPESAIYKSTDGGANWKKLKGGLPSGDLGRIGLAISPQQPDVVYAVIEAIGSKTGFYRSANGGQTWRKASSYGSSSPQYYNELFACPHRFDRVYAMDTRFQVTEDGGKTFKSIPNSSKHVDNHALAFDANDPNYLLCGCDGGLYASYDRGKTWQFTANLPLTQFYKICIDNAEPFYNIYGGTQDNNTQGGPTRTTSRHGITNEDWFITLGGDGFKPQVDPKDPNTVYSQSQYGNLARFDRRTGSRINIKPEPAEGEVLKWNWDAALAISPHLNTRIYFGANRLFQSDDRGDNWRAISPDLTRGIDRNTLEVMGRVWGVDTVAKNRSTSPYGTIVSVSESPLAAGLIYAGADDGLISVTENGGDAWRKVESIDGIEKLAYVADLEASLHQADTVFACMNNHKMGDFKPYVLKSEDRGNTWKSITGDLPEKGPAWCIMQDHVDANLLFVGTEFGLFFSTDGGEKWLRLKGGLPTIAVRDLEIQRRENDLAIGTFGRSFYIFDDYSPLRGMNEKRLETAAELFPVKKTWMFTQTARLGGRGKGSLGDAFYTAKNPPFGAIFTYYLKDSLKTRKQRRHAEEKKKVKKKEPVGYPAWDELRAEDREEKPEVFLMVADASGHPIRRVAARASSGFHRIAWDLRLPGNQPTSSGRSRPGPYALPGTYRVSLHQRIDGVDTQLGAAQTFEIVPLLEGLSAEDRGRHLAFSEKAGRLQRAVTGAGRALGEIDNRLKLVRKTMVDQPRLDRALAKRAAALTPRVLDLRVLMSGDRTVSRRQEPTTPSLQRRVSRAMSGNWNSMPTGTQAQALRIATKQFATALTELKAIAAELSAIEAALEAAGAPWTPGRIPNWPNLKR